MQLLHSGIAQRTIVHLQQSPKYQSKEATTVSAEYLESS